jgi:hypothetical protein
LPYATSLRPGRASRLALACLTVFLVALPLAVGKPGLPASLKADEPAYYLMAQSLAHDGDLDCEPEDLDRLFREFPYGEAHNLILATDDGWETVFYGKPYAYSLFAAPFAGLFGADGIVSFNLLLVMAMVWMGRAYLGRWNDPGLATLYSAGFFLVSLAFAYAFWIHPEVFMMASVAACLFLAMHESAPRPQPVGRWAVAWRRLAGPARWPLLSGGALALGCYHKPVLAALAVPALWALRQRRGWKAAAAWVLGFAVVLGLLAGLAVAWTGHPSAYLGVTRMGLTVSDPDVVPKGQPPADPTIRNKNSWTWIFRVPAVDLGQLRRNIGSFLWGRHTGLLPYLPFAGLSLMLFLLHGRRSPGRWLLLGALAVVALFFLLFIPFNWHGGGGFVGNRYFVNVYPGFLFLVTAIRPAASVLAGYAAGALFLGSLLFTPWGAPVVHPTLQAHVRGRAFAWLPLETTIMRRIPGYEGLTVAGAWFRFRKDVVDRRGEELWVQGGHPVELWMVTPEPVYDGVFAVRSEAAANEVEIATPGGAARVEFAGEPGVRLLQVAMGEPRFIDPVEGNPGFLYELEVTTRTGRYARGRDGQPIEPSFYLGAGLTYLGSKGRLEEPQWYQVRWESCAAPAVVAPGSRFAVATKLVNSSPAPWPNQGPTEVALAYHWRDPGGAMVLWDGHRTRLEAPVASGEAIEVGQRVEAPTAPGTYTLSVDLVREQIAWFSDRNGGNTCEATVVVAAETPPSDGD